MSIARNMLCSAGRRVCTGVPATAPCAVPTTGPSANCRVDAFHHDNHMLLVLPQSIIPAIASTTLGRPSLSPAFLTLLSAAPKLAALPGLDQFPSVAPHLPATNTDQPDASSTSDPASQPPHPTTASMEGRLEPAVVALQAALQAWGPALCSVSATAAGARHVANGTMRPEVPGKDMLREVAVVRRLVVAIMHALDLWALRGEGGVMGGAGAGGSVPGGRDSAGGGNTANSSAINASNGATAGAGEPTVPSTPPASGALHRLIRAAGRGMLLALRAHEACARQAKDAVMMLHVSKSGGTSMCELARLAGVKNGLHDAVGGGWGVCVGGVECCLIRNTVLVQAHRADVAKKTRVSPHAMTHSPPPSFHCWHLACPHHATPLHPPPRPSRSTTAKS